MSNGHKSLAVWQRAMDLAEKIYCLSGQFPKNEIYGLTSQIRRAAVSIPSNIAEGYGRGGKDYARFVNIAYGSVLEVETQLMLAQRLNYTEGDGIEVLINECNDIGRMLIGLKNSLLRNMTSQ